MSGRLIDATIESLEVSRAYAVDAGFDLHFISELDHLIATAKANKEVCTLQHTPPPPVGRNGKTGNPFNPKQGGK